MRQFLAVLPTFRQNRLFHINIFVMTLALSSSFSHAENKVHFQDRLKGLDLQAKIPLGQLNIGEWTTVKGNYKVKISPNKDKNSYSRKETIGFRFNLGNNFDDKLGIFGRSYINGEFIRQFSSQKDALSLRGDNRLYLPSDAPHSAKKALALKPKDYYAVEMRVAFDISASTAMMNDIALGGLKLQYIISGDFRLEVYRRSGSRVFVRASSLKEKTTNINVFAKNSFQLDVFGYNPADNALERFINGTFFDLTFLQKGKGKLFTIELEYDLSKKKARDAYEKLMNPMTWKISDLAVINPFRDSNKNVVRHVLKGKIEASEALSKKSNSGVLQNSQSETDFTRQSNGLKLNLLVADNVRTKDYLEQDFQFKMNAKDKDFERYKIATISLNRKYNIFLNWRERDLLKEANIIFELNRNLDITRFEELNFTYQRSDVRLKSHICPLIKLKDNTNIFNFCQDEIPQIAGEFRKLLPESLQDNIDLKRVFDPIVGKATFIDLDLIISPNAIQVLQTLKKDQIQFVVESFIKDVREKVESQNNKFYYGQLEYLQALNQIEDIDKYYSEKTKEIVEVLSFVLTHTKDKGTLLAQWKSLVALQNNSLFKDLGSGLFARLIDFAAHQPDQPRLEKLIFFEAKINASGLDPVVIPIGEYRRPDYTDVLLRARNNLLNRNFDPSYFDEK